MHYSMSLWLCIMMRFTCSIESPRLFCPLLCTYAQWYILLTMPYFLYRCTDKGTAHLRVLGQSCREMFWCGALPSQTVEMSALAPVAHLQFYTGKKNNIHCSWDWFKHYNHSITILPLRLDGKSSEMPSENPEYICRRRNHIVCMGVTGDSRLSRYLGNGTHYSLETGQKNKAISTWEDCLCALWGDLDSCRPGPLVPPAQIPYRLQAAICALVMTAV